MSDPRSALRLTRRDGWGLIALLAIGAICLAIAIKLFPTVFPEATIKFDVDRKQSRVKARIAPARDGLRRRRLHVRLLVRLRRLGQGLPRARAGARGDERGGRQDREDLALVASVVQAAPEGGVHRRDRPDGGGRAGRAVVTRRFAGRADGHGRDDAARAGSLGRDRQPPVRGGRARAGRALPRAGPPRRDLATCATSAPPRASGRAAPTAPSPGSGPGSTGRGDATATRSSSRATASAATRSSSRSRRPGRAITSSCDRRT